MTSPSLIFNASTAATLPKGSAKLTPSLINYSSATVESVPTSQIYVMLSFILESLAVGGIIFGGVLPYIPQYFSIRRTRNAEGFSTYVCLTLLIANILRILFWFGNRFELPLLAQSVIMIICMMMMMNICVNVRKEGELVSSTRPKYFTDFRSVDFWNWTDFLSYIQFLCTFTLVSGAVTLLLINNSTFVELLGFCAVLTEAMLGAPQFYRNHRNKSTAGMSVAMVLLWTAGDTLKTIYFLVRDAPVQFWMCGTLQILLDIAILLQVFLYKNRHTL